MDPKPVVLVRAGELPALGDYPDLASALKDAASFGVGEYLAVRILRPLSVAPPQEAPTLKVSVGSGFIKRRPKAAKATSTVEGGE